MLILIIFGCVGKGYLKVTGSTGPGSQHVRLAQNGSFDSQALRVLYELHKFMECIGIHTKKYEVLAALYEFMKL